MFDTRNERDKQLLEGVLMAVDAQRRLVALMEELQRSGGGGDPRRIPPGSDGGPVLVKRVVGA